MSYVVSIPFEGKRKIMPNISLRDIKPSVVIGSYNYFDDVDHCLKMQTSPHLTELKYKTRDFVNVTIAQIIQNKKVPASDKLTIFLRLAWAC